MTVTAAAYGDRVGEAWNPWAAVRDRDDIEVGIVPLPAACGGAVQVEVGDGFVVLVDQALKRTGRNAALAHEMVHVERGGIEDCAGAAAGWAAVVAKEEGIVRAITARRLVPLGELAVLLDRCADMGHCPDVWELAEEFGVPDMVMTEALAQLAREGYGERWAG